jgi:hypothetical protein
MLRRLRCPAAGDEDGEIFFIRSGGPEQMVVRAAPGFVLPASAIVIECLGRRRIRITLVEVLDFRGYVRHVNLPFT